MINDREKMFLDNCRLNVGNTDSGMMGELVKMVDRLCKDLEEAEVVSKKNLETFEKFRREIQK